jgi:hypothetical protein
MIGEALADWCYDWLFKPTIDGLINFIGDQFNSLAKVANEKIKLGGVGIWDILKGIFVGIPVYAEEDQAYNVGQLWRNQFGASYDYKLSEDALDYVT